MGLRGAHVTVGRRGVTRTVGIPGSGIYYTSRSGHHTGVHHEPGRDGGRGGLLLPLVLLAIAVGLLVAVLGR